MKFASYNVLQGCFDSYSQDAKLTARFGLLKDAVKKIDADFISLVDTFRWVENFSVSDLRNSFGYKYVYSINMNDIRVDLKIGITVLTNIYVKSLSSVRIETRDCLFVTLQADNQEIDVFCVYLDDLSEDLRQQQICRILDAVDPERSVIIMGDLNTFHKKDLASVDGLLNECYSMYPEQLQSFRLITDDMERSLVCDEIEHRGFHDVFEGMPFSPTFPTSIFPIKIEKPIVRVDYAFVKNLSVKKPKVYYGGEFDFSSDHYPISFEI